MNGFKQDTGSRLSSHRKTGNNADISNGNANGNVIFY